MGGGGGGGGKGMSVVLQSNPRILNKAFKYSYDSWSSLIGT